MFSENYYGEIWKPVYGYYGLYDVSNFGRVKSLNYNHTGNSRVLIPLLSRSYMQVGLWKNRKAKVFKVHRLVWEAFNGPIPKGMQVNHINENKSDNRLENLNLMTPKENVNWGTGIKRRAAKKSKSIIQKDLSGKVIRVWQSEQDIVDYLKVASASHISACCHGKRTKAHGFLWSFKEDN